jgi:hypothetical protein
MLLRLLDGVLKMELTIGSALIHGAPAGENKDSSELLSDNVESIKTLLLELLQYDQIHIYN